MGQLRSQVGSAEGHQLGIGSLGRSGKPDAAAPRRNVLRGLGCDETLQCDDTGAARPGLVGAVGEGDANR